MLLDVLLPFHEDDFYFQQSLESLANSNFQDFRVILIDDRISKIKELSSETSAILNTLNYVLLKTEGGVGYGRALELGSKVLASKYVCLFNSDDLISPRRFSTQIKLLDSSDLTFSKMKKFSRSNSNLPFLLGEILDFYHPLFLLFGSYGADASLMTRTEWWKENAFFDSYDCLDWRIALRTFDTVKISISKEYLYFYRKHAAQATNNRKAYSDISPVFELWKTKCENYNLEGMEFSTFRIMAAPWIKPHNLTLKEFDTAQSFAVSVNNFCYKNYLKEELEAINKFIARRYLLAFFFNVNNPKIAIRLLVKGRAQILQLLVDLLKLFINHVIN